MKKLMKKCLNIYLIAAVVLTMALGTGAAAWADEGAAGGQLVATGYTVNSSRITKGARVNITVNLKHTLKTIPADADVSRMVDSFSGGTVETTVPDGGSAHTMTVTLKDLTYSGTGKSLKLMVGIGSDYEQIEIPISECVEYEEPVYEPVTPVQPEPVPAPTAIISRNEMPASLKAKEERTITVYVKNTGSITMTNPVISFTASDCLILPGASSSMEMKSIAPGKTESVDIRVKAMDTVTSASQYLEAELKFQYFNRVATVEGTSTGRITIPAKVTKEKKEEPKEEKVVTDSPVPNLIITRFDYGGASVPAGSAFDLSFVFANTSSKLAAENVVVTVEGGEGFTVNGSTNTFYFSKVKAGGKKTVTVPMKVMQTVANGPQSLSVSFKYEYVDHKKRNAATADLKITVPVYQKDRFEISRPVVPAMVYAGEENSVTMTYVNKGKSDILNVEAALEGDVETYTPVQNIGNLEPGKSGTLTFSVTALEAGEAEFTIKITYEDANGDTKTREFPVLMNVEEMMMEDPGMEEPVDPGMEEPEKNGPSLPLILAIGAAVVIAAVIIIRKRRKAAALKKEAALWDSWDDDMTMPAGSADAISSAGGTDHAGSAGGATGSGAATGGSPDSITGANGVKGTGSKGGRRKKK